MAAQNKNCFHEQMFCSFIIPRFSILKNAYLVIYTFIKMEHTIPTRAPFRGNGSAGRGDRSLGERGPKQEMLCKKPEKDERSYC